MDKEQRIKELEAKVKQLAERLEELSMGLGEVIEELRNKKVLRPYGA
jgi:hypothetical protein